MSAAERFAADAASGLQEGLLLRAHGLHWWTFESLQPQRDPFRSAGFGEKATFTHCCSAAQSLQHFGYVDAPLPLQDNDPPSKSVRLCSRPQRPSEVLLMDLKVAAAAAAVECCKGLLLNRQRALSIECFLRQIATACLLDIALLMKKQLLAVLSVVQLCLQLTG